MDNLTEQLGELNRAFEALREIISSIPFDKLTEEQKGYIDGMKQLADTTATFNQNAKGSSEILTSQISQLNSYRTAIDGVITVKRKLSDADAEMQGKIKALNQVIRDNQAELTRMMQITGSVNNQMGDIFTTRLNNAKNELNNLTASMKAHTEQVKLTEAANTSLDNILKELTKEYNALSPEVKKNDANAKEMADTINRLTLYLKEEKAALSGANTELGIMSNINKQIEQTTAKLNSVLSDENKLLIDLKIQLANITKELELQANPEKRIALMQKEQQARLKIIEQEQLAREKELQAEMEMQDKATKNALDNDLKKVEAEEAMIRKMLDLQAKRLAQIEENEDKITQNTLANDLKKVEADQEAQRRSAQAAEEAEMRKQKAAEKTTFMYKLQQFVVRDLFRLIAAMLTIYPLMAFIGFVTDAIKVLFGFGEETTRAKEANLEFQESLHNVSIELEHTMALELEKIELLIKSSNDLNLSYVARVDAIGKLRDAYGELLDKYSDVDLAESKKAKEDRDKADKLKKDSDMAQKAYELRLGDIERLKKAINDANAFIADAKTKGLLSHLVDFNKVSDLEKAKPIYRKQLEEDESNLGEDKRKAEEAKMKYEEFIHPKDVVENLKRLEAELALKKESRSRIPLPAELDELRKKGATINQYEAVLKQHPEYDNKVVELQKEIDELEKEIKAIKGKHDPKGGKGPNPLHQALTNERARTKDAQDMLTTEYDENNPYNTYEDDIAYHEKQKTEADKHYNNMVALARKYRHTMWETEMEYSTNMINADKEMREVKNKSNEAENKIFEERRKRYNEALKEIEDFNRRIEKSSRELDILIDKYKLAVKKGAKDKKDAGKTNPLLAAFGVENEKKDFDDNQIALQNQIDEKAQEIERTKFDRDRVSGRYLNETSDLETLGLGIKGNTDAEKVSNDKTGEYKIKLGEKQKTAEELKIIDQKIVEQSQKMKELADQKELNDIRLKEQAKRDLIKGTFDFAKQIANQEFELQKARIQNQIQATQAAFALEMTLAGNNVAARQKLAREQSAEMKKLKREEARVEKQSALFQALIDTAAGEAAILGKYGATPLGLALMALTLAKGLSTVAFINARPLPAYKYGRRGGPAEVAKINEEGAEIIEDKHGKLKIFGDGKETIAALNEGDTVHTHKESLNMIGSTNFIKDLAAGAQMYVNKERNDKVELYKHLALNMLSKGDYKDAMVDAIKTMPSVTIQLPAQSLQDRHTRQQLRNGL